MTSKGSAKRKSGADIIVPDIHLAASRNDLDEVINSLRADPDCLNSQRASDGATALHIAIGLGNLSIVQVLLDQPNVDLTRLTRGGKDCLEVAIAVGHLEISKRLFALRAKQVGISDPITNAAEIVQFKPR